VYTSAESTLRNRLAAAEADRERLREDGESVRRERDALRAAAAEDRAAMEKELEALKSVVVENQRDAARRGETEAALRRENQQLRADAELLTPRTGKEILAARLEKAAATEKELRAEVASRTPRASKMKILAELNSVAGERDKLRAAADEHAAAAQRFRDEMGLVRREVCFLSRRGAFTRRRCDGRCNGASVNSTRSVRTGGRVARAGDAGRRRGGGGGGAARAARRGGGGGVEGARQATSG